MKKYSTVMAATKIALRNKIFTFGILISGILSIVLGVVTFYGQQSGNFVMNVNYDTYARGIVIADNRTMTNAGPQLTSDSLSDAKDITYWWLDIETAQETDGNYYDPDFDYLAYTFYIQNQGTETVDITYSLRVTDVYKNLDEAVRIIFIDDGVETIYQKEDEANEFGVLPTYPVSISDASLFIDDNTVFRTSIIGFTPNTIKKFTIIIYLEGEDPDTTDDLLGSMIRFRMTFSIDEDET
eukprot:Anaeramoba_ignava/a90141_120.p6 GENE.a90141_120~~a90141_120.p6  ORF type:complete len:240 (-),score=15.41 a90141_120:8614-9333(-)